MSDAGRQVSAVMHVHSRISGGRRTPGEIGKLAQEQGVRAVLFSDKAERSFAYGVKPFRGLARVSMARESVPMSDVEGYLRSIGDAQAATPGVLMIPGFEVAPFYRWEGDLSRGDLTLLETNCELLVYGLKKPDDWRGMPTISNPYAARYSFVSVLQLLFCGILVACAAAAALNRRGRGLRIVVRRKQRVVFSRRFYPLLSGIFLTAALVLGCMWYPLKRYPYSPYGRPGVSPYQLLIDYTASRGGVTVWVHPETKFIHRFNVKKFLHGPAARLPFLSRISGGFSAEVRNDGCVEPMMAARGFTAYSALYEGLHRVGCTGCLWDSALSEYAEGRRGGAPLWAAAERDFYGNSFDLMPFGDDRTVFITREFSEQGVLDALRAGRMYGTRYDFHRSLRLYDFAVESGGRSAEMGGAVEFGGGGARVSGVIGSIPRGMQVRATLIRNGKPVRSFGGRAPVAFDFTFSDPPAGRMDYYRVIADNASHAFLMSNPIFVKKSR